MATQTQVLELLDQALGLQGRALTFTLDTPLLGALPELDSMSVITLLTALEEQFGIVASDDEIDGSTLATVGSLLDFLQARIQS